jgi:hypothetical protein
MNVFTLPQAPTCDPRTNAVSVPAIVAAGLARSAVLRRAVATPVPGDAFGHAVRAERLAEIYAREARWWAVLERHIYSPASTVPLIYGDAVIIARLALCDDARFWAETAADWRARAERRPTSDAAGALSNHADFDDLGVVA